MEMKKKITFQQNKKILDIWTIWTIPPISLIFLKLFTCSQILQVVPLLFHATVHLDTKNTLNNNNNNKNIYLQGLLQPDFSRETR